MAFKVLNHIPEADSYDPHTEEIIRTTHKKLSMANKTKTFSLCLGLVVAIYGSTCAAPAESRNDPPTAWCHSQYVEPYTKRNQGNPWDHDALKVLNAAACRCAGSNDCPSLQETGALAKTVIDAGCNDPLIYYLYYVSLRAAGSKGQDGELIGPDEIWLRKALDGFRRLEYPKARTMDAALSVALLETRSTKAPTDASKALASEAVDAEIQAILNKEYQPLTHQSERNRFIHNLNYLCDLGEQAGMDTAEAFGRILDHVEGKADPFVLDELDKIASHERIADHREWSKLERTAKRLLRCEKFDELEFMALELHKFKPRFHNGEWMSVRFYDSLALWCKSSPEEWDKRFELVNRWVKTKPNSVTAQIVLARTYFEYGWNARGGGYAGTVTQEGWKLFQERLQKARTILESVTPQERKDPEWYRLMLMVLADSSDMPEYDRYLKKGIVLEPSYDWFYRLSALYSLPRWYGKTNDWLGVAEAGARNTSVQSGEAMYTRVVWHIWDTAAGSQKQFDGKFFDENHVSWPRMKQGFCDIEKGCTNSLWNLNSFCRFACLARDKQTARELFKRIGKNWDVEIWYHRAEYNMWRQWAQSPDVHRPSRSLLSYFTRYGWVWLSVFFVVVLIYLGFRLKQERQLVWGVPPPKFLA